MATLSAKGWLSETPAEFRSEVLKLAEWRRVEAGQSIMIAGDEEGGIFGLAAGSVAAFTSLGSPDSPVLTIVKPGFWFGEGVLITGKPRVISTVANTTSELAYVPRLPLKKLLTARPEWWQEIARLALQSTFHMTNAASDLTIRDTERRSAAVLLRLADRRFGDNGATAPAEAVITQDTLATLANLSRSTTSAVLNRLASQGVISLHNRRILIKDPAALRSLADDL